MVFVTDEVVGKKCIITAAMSGAATFKDQNENVPYTPEEFVEEAIKCEEAGASIVHIHARDPESGWPSTELDIWEEILNGIRDETDLIVNFSTAIGMGAEKEERIQHIKNLDPDMASLNTNSMNFGMANWKTGEIEIDYIFENEFEMIEEFAKVMREEGVKPELECYDLSGFSNVFLLDKKDIFEKPLHFQFVFGVAGGAAFNPHNFLAFKNHLPENATWSTCGVGPNEFPLAMMTAAAGGHIRVGLEDNINIRPGEKADGNYELVEKAVSIAEKAGRGPATPEEAKEILKIEELENR